MNIKNVSNSIWTKKDLRNSDFDMDFNQIKVDFDVDIARKLKIKIGSVLLKNELGDELPYNEGNPSKTYHGITNAHTLYLNFEMDECELLDGAQFTIVLQDPDTKKWEKHIWMREEEKWTEISYLVRNPVKGKRK